MQMALVSCHKKNAVLQEKTYIQWGRSGCDTKAAEMHFRANQRNLHRLDDGKEPMTLASRILGWQKHCEGVRWEKWTLHSVTLHCLKHVWPPLIACWPEKLEHLQRAPSASSRCHTSENRDALAKRVKMQKNPASQHAPHTRPTVCDTCKSTPSGHAYTRSWVGHDTSRLAFPFSRPDKPTNFKGAGGR